MTENRTIFERAVVAARPALVNAARKMGAGDAEDLAQEAILAALQCKNWERIGNPGAWTHTIMCRCAWKSRQESAKRHADFDACMNSIQSEEGDIVDRIIEEEEIAEKIATVMDAMQGAGLTRHEDYVVLARLRGKTDEEIADILGLCRDTIKVYHSTALAKIRRQLQGENNG